MTSSELLLFLFKHVIGIESQKELIIDSFPRGITENTSFLWKTQRPKLLQKKWEGCSNTEISFMLHWYIDPPNSFSNTVIIILRSISVQNDIVVKTEILLNRRLCLLYPEEKGLHTCFYTAFST